MIPLPKIMVAPNGARIGKIDHPQVPIRISEIVNTAIACKDAGADGMHAHVRNKGGRHVLDAGLYRELLRECQQQLPEFYVQITTEANRQYSPADQVELMRDLMPAYVSVSFAELGRIPDENEQAAFYLWAQANGIQVQHILYDAGELLALYEMMKNKNNYCHSMQLLFVLGRYTDGNVSTPQMLDPFLAAMAQIGTQYSSAHDWAVCAFGDRETECLVLAFQAGGKVRVGFENNIYNLDGSIAKTNAERVREVASAVKSL